MTKQLAELIIKYQNLLFFRKRGLFYLKFLKRNVQSKHVCQLAYNVYSFARLRPQNLKLTNKKHS